MIVPIGLQVIAVYGGKFTCTLSLIGLYPFNIYILIVTPSIYIPKEQIPFCGVTNILVNR